MRARQRRHLQHVGRIARPFETCAPGPLEARRRLLGATFGAAKHVIACFVGPDVELRDEAVEFRRCQDVGELARPGCGRGRFELGVMVACHVASVPDADVDEPLSGITGSQTPP